MAKVISIEKSVQHYNGDSWELENYPPFAETDNAEEWLGVSEISLERAKELAFELAGDEAYDYQEDIEEASDLYELQDVLDNFKYYQRDNTYNASWWGGVVDFGVLTEDGEGYGTGLVLLRMHRGGDPRGNYYEMRAFELDSFIEDFPPYLSRLTYYIKTDEGDLTLDTEDSEGYSLMVVEDETGTFEENDSVKIDEIEEEFDMDGNSFFKYGGGVKKHYARGGSSNSGVSWHQDRAKHNKSEDYEIPMSKRKFAGGGGVNISPFHPMDTYNKIRHYMLSLGFEVDEIQPTDNSVGISNGYVTFTKQNDKTKALYEIDFDDLTYYIYHNGTREDILKDTFLVDEDEYAGGGGVGRITEKDFVEKKQFKRGNTIIKLEKLSNPTYYRVRYIDLIDNESSSYGSANFQDVIFDINETKFAGGGGVRGTIHLWGKSEDGTLYVNRDYEVPINIYNSDDEKILEYLYEQGLLSEMAYLVITMRGHHSSKTYEITRYDNKKMSKRKFAGGGGIDDLIRG